MDKKYVLIGILTGVFIGFSIVIMSHVTKSVHPFVFTTISSLVSLPFLFFLSFLFKGKGLKAMLSTSKKDFFSVFLERFIIASGILLTFGVSLTLAMRSVFLIQLEPVFVLLWSALLLKERIRKDKLFLIISLILGAFLITTGGSLDIIGAVLVGDILILASLVLLSHSYILSARLMKTANPMKLYLGFSVMGVPIFAALALLFLPLTSFYISLSSLALIAAASLFFNVIGFPLWLISLKKLKPWVLASSLLVQTTAGAALSYFWLGQTLSLVQISGGIIILISIYFIGSRG